MLSPASTIETLRPVQSPLGIAAMTILALVF